MASLFNPVSNSIARFGKTGHDKWETLRMDDCVNCKEKAQRWVEFVALYVGMPVVVALWLPPWTALPALWVGGCVAWGLLALTRRDAECVSPLADDWGVPSRKALAAVGMRFAVGAALLTGLLLWHCPKYLLFFPKTAPIRWGIVMIAYPVLSVLPQVVVYRLLFFRRYAPLFAHETVAWVVGALVFSLAHLPFGNRVAMLFTFVGGLLFIHTYRKTRSVWLNVLEHSLYGDFLFTIGWGIYFFHGGTQAIMMRS